MSEHSARKKCPARGALKTNARVRHRLATNNPSGSSPQTQLETVERLRLGASVPVLVRTHPKLMWRPHLHSLP
eukprot:7051842-Pyramimonas_sp.AAC.1